MCMMVVSKLYSSGLSSTGVSSGYCRRHHPPPTAAAAATAVSSASRRTGAPASREL